MANEFALSEEQRKTLEAAAERIIPSDDGPGAAETGVSGYICSELKSDFFRNTRSRVVYLLGHIEELAQDSYGDHFFCCETEEQDCILESVQLSSDRRVRLCFRMLVQLSVEGFLCDPSRGGNSDGLGWEYVGYKPYRPFVGDLDDKSHVV